MLILALDTTTRAGSLAVVDAGGVRALHAGDGARTHGERLPGEIAAVLAAAGVGRTAIDLLVVASGPGAFTGMRIGLAAMQGLAMTLDRPIVGVSALDALAWSVLRDAEPARDAAAPPAVAAWMDAQRGEVFSAHYTGPASEDLPWTTASVPHVGPPEAAAAAGLDTDTPVIFAGDGARRYASIIHEASPRWSVLADTPLLAPALAVLGRRAAARGGAVTPHALQPLYVRRPDAEIERDRRTQAAGGDGAPTDR